jgi:hypothetical protein
LEARRAHISSVWASLKLGKAFLTAATSPYRLGSNATMASQSLDDSDITVSDVIWGGRKYMPPAQQTAKRVLTKHR